MEQLVRLHGEAIARELSKTCETRRTESGTVVFGVVTKREKITKKVEGNIVTELVEEL